MKMGKNKKAEIATVLTLVLMVVGVVVSVLTSKILNNTRNLSSVPKAGTDSGFGINPTNQGSYWNYITRTIIPTNTSTPTSSYSCSRGIAVERGSSGCYDTCASKNMKYISNSQGQGTDGNFYCCCEQTPVSQGYDVCYKAYQKGLYGCGADENKVVIYAKSMSAVGMTSCEAYNKGSTTALYFSGKIEDYENGKCYKDVWDGNMDLSAKNDRAAKLKNTPTPTISSGSEGGVCKDLYREDMMWYGKCNQGLLCDYKTGKCVKPQSPPSNSPPPGCTTPILNQGIKTCSRGGGVLTNGMWCCSPTSTPPPGGGSQASGSADTIMSGQEIDCPPPAFCSTETSYFGLKLTCGSGFYDYKIEGLTLTCKKDGISGKCCLPKPTGVIISKTIPTPTNYMVCKNYLCLNLCLTLGYPFSKNYNTKVSKSNNYYPYHKDFGCINNELLDATEIINYCGCTKNISDDLFQSQENIDNNILACYDAEKKLCVVYSINSKK